MREMKDSGIEWIGEIPRGWETDRLQWHLNEINVQNSPVQTEQVLSLTIDAGVILYEDKGNQGNKAKENYEEYKLAYPNTLVVNSMNIIIGAVGISKYFGCVSPVYYVFKAAENTDLRYIYYLFTNVGFQKEMRKYAKGILEIRLRISASDMLRLQIPKPTYAEQRRIADFLDRKCAEIDAVIEKTKAAVEEYKKLKQSVITEAVTKGVRGPRPMKPSGVEWIGDVPEGWELRKLKFLCNVQTGNEDTQNADPNGEYPFYVRSPIVERCQRFTFEGEGILMAGDGAGAGRVFHHAYGKYAVHQRVYRLCNFNNINTDYFFYYLSNLFPSVMNQGSAQSTVPSVRLPMLLNFEVCIPTPIEQTEIVSYLDRKCLGIDNILDKKQQFIKELEAYKKSLIYEYVTGKKEVKS